MVYIVERMEPGYLQVLHDMQLSIAVERQLLINKGL